MLWLKIIRVDYFSCKMGFENAILEFSQQVRVSCYNLHMRIYDDCSRQEDTGNEIR